MSKVLHSMVSLIIAAAVFSVGGLACGPGLVGAKEAVARAEQEGQKLTAGNTPDSATLSYRMQIKKAQTSLEKHHYKKAVEEARSAENSAKQTTENRDRLAADTRARLPMVRRVIESQARPARDVLEGYFDALEAMERKDYEKAAETLSRVETILLRETRIVTAPGVAIQGDEQFYREKRIIPVYADVSETGEPGKVILDLRYPIKAVFMGHKIISRNKIFTHIFIEDEKFRIEGWVDHRFVQ